MADTCVTRSSASVSSIPDDDHLVEVQDEGLDLFDGISFDVRRPNSSGWVRSRYQAAARECVWAAFFECGERPT